MKRIYIAGPYSAGDVAVNVRNAIQAANSLLDWGFWPYCPHLTHFQHLLFPRPYEDWLRLDLEWLAVCDAVLRLPGMSPGADREVARAHELDLPVFHDILALSQWAKRVPRREIRELLEAR